MAPKLGIRIFFFSVIPLIKDAPSLLRAFFLHFEAKLFSMRFKHLPRAAAGKARCHDQKYTAHGRMLPHNEWGQIVTLTGSVLMSVDGRLR